MSLCIEIKFLLVGVLAVHRSSKVICSLPCIKFQNPFERINSFFVYTEVYIHNVFCVLSSVNIGSLCGKTKEKHYLKMSKGKCFPHLKFPLSFSWSNLQTLSQAL